MTPHEFKVGDRVRVTKKRRPDVENRNGVVVEVDARNGLCLVQHVRWLHGQENIHWSPSSLEINDHREPCACYECPI